MNCQTIYPGRSIIGSCSLCGGPVLVHDNWFSITPDVPTCGNCGAVKADTHGPVIPMAPAPKVITTTKFTLDAVEPPNSVRGEIGEPS
jgi:hypothetical protein